MTAPTNTPVAPFAGAPASPTNPLDALLGSNEQRVVYIHNTMAGPTVFTVDATRADGHIEWQGNGDVHGLDVRPVPVEMIANNLQFQDAIRKGILEIVEDPIQAQAALLAQQAAWDSQVERQANVDPDAIWGEDGSKVPTQVEKANQNDFAVQDCVANSLPAIGCDQRVSLRLKEVGVKPPLCPAHSGLAGRFVSVEDHESPLVNGKAPVRWITPTMG